MYMYVPCVYDIRYISGNYGRPGKDTRIIPPFNLISRGTKDLL